VRDAAEAGPEVGADDLSGDAPSTASNPSACAANSNTSTTTAAGCGGSSRNGRRAIRTRQRPAVTATATTAISSTTAVPAGRRAPPFAAIAETKDNSSRPTTSDMTPHTRMSWPTLRCR
jgi:hypothetical protein